MRLVIIGNTSNGDIAKALLECEEIEIIAGVIDNYSKETQRFQSAFLQEHKIPKISFDEILALKPDMCLSIAYFTLMDTKYFKDILALNIHAGILPVWKGFNANAWAMINGEEKIGYSLHALTDKMDGGEVYYQWIENVGECERYAQIVQRVKNRAVNEIAKVLLEIYQGKLTPRLQDTSIEYFCKKIGQSESMIKTWNLKAQELYNRFRVVAAPYGGGLFFHYKNKVYEIMDMQSPRDSLRGGGVYLPFRSNCKYLSKLYVG
ncbi:formyltransferase family protein [Helicobacter sp. MIT 21-1697]|uniref:formyltransferase family protein n=1 Tax=Helicobacter sp. MIT 21-1697 TaxID=2993733 RepID=UPI00224AFA64|nr:formyltransferase family protein [Helicobacter sp. MIT 21-1697]MCX2717887.1 formyltransferase family protein [Helicobacter sp. MIT 21-1697]